MNADGWVVIGSKLDTKELEKELNRSLSELRKYEKEAQKLTEQKAKIELDLSDYEREKQAIAESTDARLKYAQTEEQVSWVLDEEKMEIEQLNSKYSKQFQQLETINGKIKDNASAQEAVKNKVQQMNEQLGKTQGFTSIRNAIDHIGHSMNGIINKVTRWGLAVFGIRGAYMAVRRAISIVSAENEGVANSFQQIRHVIANTLLPIVQTVINWIVKLMTYINYLWKAFTGKTLFNFADATKKASNNLASGAGSSGKIAKNLKEAKKQLASFDEMNVLQDMASNTGGGGAGGGAGGIGDADFGNIFDKLKDIPIPKWLKWIGDHGDFVRKVLEGIAAAIWAIKKRAGLLKGLGMFLVIDGILNLIRDLKAYLDAPTWKNFAKVLADIGEILTGFGFIIGFTNPLGVILAIVGQIVTIISALPEHLRNILNFIKDPSWENFVTTVKSGIDSMGIVGKAINWVLEQLGIFDKALGNLEVTQRDLRKSNEKLIDSQKRLTNAFDNAEDASKKLREAEKQAGITGEELYKKVQSGELTYQSMTGTQKNVYKAYLDNISAQENLKTAEEEAAKAIERNRLLTEAEKISKENNTDATRKYRDAVVKAYKDGSVSAEDASKMINTATKNMSNDNKKTFTRDIPSDIKKGLDTNQYESKWNSFRSSWKTKFLNKLTTKITLSVVLGPVGGVISAFDSLLNKLKGKSTVKVKAKKSAKGAIVKLPKLAVGGVVNQPGRGVPLGGAITGERGAEGVIPLTDSQQMALLGEAIGRYITVNASITNTMNGRVISRELKKVQNEDNFAFNR